MQRALSAEASDFLARNVVAVEENIRLRDISLEGRLDHFVFKGKQDMANVGASLSNYSSYAFPISADMVERALRSEALQAAIPVANYEGWSVLEVAEEIYQWLKGSSPEAADEARKAA